MPPTRLVTPEDLRDLVTVADPQISPDGHHVALLRKASGERNTRRTELWLASSVGALRSRPLTAGPRDSMPRWSPDGSTILFVRAKEKASPQLALIRLDDSTLGRAAARGRRPSRGSTEGTERLPSVKVLTSLPEGTITALQWSSDGTRVAFLWRRTMAQFTSNAIKARKASGASTPPLVIDDPWYRLDGDGYFGSARHRLCVLDIRRGSPREVFACEHLDDITFEWSPDGRMLAVACNRDPRALFHPERTEIVLVDPDARRDAQAIAGLPVGPKSNPRWSPDGTRLAWAGRRGRSTMYDTANVELWSATISGSAMRPKAQDVRSLTASSDCCLMVGTLSDTADASFAPWFCWAADGRSLLARVGWHGAGRIASVSARGGRVTLHTDGGADLMPNTISLDGMRIACVRSAPTEPPEIAVAEVLGHQFDLSVRTAFNAAFRRSRRLVQPTEHWVSSSGTDATARSGRSASTGAFAPPRGVHTWVMRPPRGAPRRSGAAVLEVHGGPHAQYGVAFFHEFQVLAAQGYTVVYSNPRGSKGYGARFCGAIKGRWGTADWDDVKSVTRFMSRLAGVRPSRLGIMGGSYGGYMTNWAIAHSRAYRAAITDRCVSNQVSMCGSSDYPEVPDLYWPGVAWDRPQALWRSSPIAHFKGVRTPTLIIHSEGDLRCNIEQAEQVHAALVAQDVPCRFVRYPRETSHGMSRVGPADLRIHRLHQILGWWAAHLA